MLKRISSKYLLSMSVLISISLTCIISANSLSAAEKSNIFNIEEISKPSSVEPAESNKDLLSESNDKKLLDEEAINSNVEDSDELIIEKPDMVKLESSPIGSENDIKMMNMSMRNNGEVHSEEEYRHAMGNPDIQNVVIGSSFSFETSAEITVNGVKNIVKSSEASEAVIDFNGAYHELSNSNLLTIDSVVMKSQSLIGRAFLSNITGTVNLTNMRFEGNVLLTQQSSTTLNITGSEIIGLSKASIAEVNRIVIRNSTFSNSSSTSTISSGNFDIRDADVENFRFNLTGTSGVFTTDGTVNVNNNFDSYLCLRNITCQSNITFKGNTNIVAGPTINGINLSQGAKDNNINFDILGNLSIQGGKHGIYKESEATGSSNILMTIESGAELNLKGFRDSGVSFSRINEFILTQKGNYKVSSSWAGSRGLHISGDQSANYKHFQTSGEYDVTVNGIGFDNEGQTILEISGSNSIFSVYGQEAAMKVRAGKLISQNIKAFNIKSPNEFPLMLYADDNQEFLMEYSGNTKPHLVGNDHDSNSWNLSQSSLMFDGATNNINTRQSSPSNVVNYIRDNRGAIDFITIGEHITLLPPEPDEPIEEAIIELIVPSAIDFGIVNLEDKRFLVNRKSCIYDSNHSSYDSEDGSMTVAIHDNRKNSEGEFTNGWNIKLKGQNQIESADEECKLLDSENLIFRKKVNNNEYTDLSLSSQIEVIRGAVSGSHITEKLFDRDEGVLIDISREKMMNMTAGKYKVELVWSIEDTPTE